ncbi:RDD family protein [Streptomyces scabiei]|uniref:RDD family protein n=1 Tax=Streptomyces scabiei TaxID=1930 RepID=UPI0038D3C95D
MCSGSCGACGTSRGASAGTTRRRTPSWRAGSGQGAAGAPRAPYGPVPDAESGGSVLMARVDPEPPDSASGTGPYPNDPLAGMPPLADSGKRVLARIIDMILVGLVVWLLAWAFRISQYTVNSDDFEFGKSLAQEALAAVLYIAYDTVLTVRDGRTLGKKLLKLRVADLDDGSTPSTQTALIRAAVLWIPFAFCCACIWTAIAGGWSFFDRPYKQGLHDKAAKTVVVSTP